MIVSWVVGIGRRGGISRYKIKGVVVWEVVGLGKRGGSMVR